MAGTRALFASIGASVALVVAAALALLAVSAVFAFGGWSDFGGQGDDDLAPLIFADATSRVTVAPGRTERIVVRAPEPPRREAARPAGTPRRTAERANVAGGIDPGEPVTHVDPPKPEDLPGREDRPPPPPPPPPSTGDRVAGAGESISGKVQSAGAALAEATAPLAAPVSQAVQQVLNLVAEVVRRTSDGLGGAVDSLLAPKR